MKKFAFSLIVQLLVSVAEVVAELTSQTYELPSLLVSADQLYLHKKFATNLTCELAAGYSEARLSSVKWLKNNEFLQLPDADYEISGADLMILGVKPQNEGLYQCVADVTSLRLSNGQLIETRLVSVPVKLRRSRMTKFEKISDHAITVRENEVARLPCAGLPDIVPGPPTICFERLHHEGCLGSKNGTKHLTTNTGIQISLVQPSDAGFYHCVVRNEFTNQTRRSPKPVLLYVRENNSNSTEKTPGNDIVPTLMYPAKETSIDKPILVDVVEGDEVLLECVISLAKIVWIKHNDTTPIISMNDNNSRFQQVWGNLRIKSVASGDSGVYSCIGMPMLGTNDVIDETTRPRVDYNLVVHSPTTVHLTLNQQSDRSYMLECLATNLQYEIPMAFINGTALMNSINLMGIPSNTNFYTNPIRVQLQVSPVFSGSVQCISRPPMEEAEIYGMGMERGRSKNLFVMSNYKSVDDLIIQGPSNLTIEIGKTADLPCLVQRVRSKSWKKDDTFIQLFSNRTQIVGSNSLRIKMVEKGDEGLYTCVVMGQSMQQSQASAYLKVVEFTTSGPDQVTTTEPFLIKKKDDKIDVEDVRGFVTGTEVRIQWSVFGKMEALTQISKFIIEVQRFGASNDSWIEAESVDSYVRATTIKNLVPEHKYQLRIKLVRENGSTVVSQPTTWMNVELPTGDVMPVAPKIEEVRQISWEGAVVSWTHSAPVPSAAAKTFVIIYSVKGSNKTLVAQVDGDKSEAIIESLEVPRQYAVNVVAENAAGKSQTSTEFLFNTTEPGTMMLLRGYLDTLSPHVTFKNLALAGIVFFVAMLILVVCCFVFCNLRTAKKPKPKTQANGKFFDTSNRIFNEQKVHKSRITHDRGNIYTSDVDETVPLRSMSDGDVDRPNSKFDFSDRRALPNVYGQNEDIEYDANAGAPNDPNYVCTIKRNARTDYMAHNTARCYSPESGVSHEMLVSYSQSVNGSSPQMNTSSQRVVAYKYPDSLLYSPAGTSSSIADTSSSGIVTNRLTCDSPTNPPTDESDQGIRCGGSSRNSHISSNDGTKTLPMHTFKGTMPSSFMSTFERRKPLPI